MTRKILPSLLLLVAACAPAADPADAPNIITPLTLEPPPIYALLGYRQELSLESRQIAELDSIAERIQERNAPLIDSLQSIGDRGGRGFIQIDERTEPLLERIRANNRSAMAEVREVLTEEQESTTCRLFNEARSRRLQERGRARAPAPRPGTRADSAALGMGGLVWAWCSA